MSVQRDCGVGSWGSTSNSEEENEGEGLLFNGLNRSPSSGDSQASDDCDNSPSLPSPSSCGGCLSPSFTLNNFEVSTLSSVNDVNGVKCSYSFKQETLTGSSEDPKYPSEGSMVQTQPSEIGNLKCPTLTQKQSKSKQHDHLRRPLAHLNNHPQQNPKMKDHCSQKDLHPQVWSQKYKENVQT